LTAIEPILRLPAPDAPSVLPGLNPNQPHHLAIEFAEIKLHLPCRMLPGTKADALGRSTRSAVCRAMAMIKRPSRTRWRKSSQCFRSSPVLYGRRLLG
jgi:hypothetical protein